MFDEAKTKVALQRVSDTFGQALRAIHTGRAKPEMLESLSVEVYGQNMELKSLSTIEILDGKFRLQPWDPTARKAIEAAIRSSNLGLNPEVREDAIYVSVPPLTQDTRLKRVKEVGTMLEEAKIRVRKVRHDMLSGINGMEGVSEDIQKSATKRLQALVDECNAQLEQIAKAKEEEILKV